MCQIKLTATKKLLTFYVICACGPPSPVAQECRLGRLNRWPPQECGEASGAVGGPPPKNVDWAAKNVDWAAGEAAPRM